MPHILKMEMHRTPISKNHKTIHFFKQDNVTFFNETYDTNLHDKMD